jgi:NAD(P)-dependent dehydrogenase (short-subunit alcohol dehydrogenase family)
MANWTADQIPNLQGKIAIVTGGNSGLGYESVLALARKNAHVVLAARNDAKAQAARAMVMKEVPNASIELLRLDLSDLDSVRTFADAFHSCHERLDILINNAGMMVPTRQETAQGMELQMGTNHFGHFALTGLLLETLLATPNSRVVTVSSALYQTARLDLDDLHSRRNYDMINVYAKSKLANLYFMRELYHRLMQRGSTTLSVAAHPGGANTSFKWEEPWFLRTIGNALMPFMNQSAAMGALPQLLAATDPTVKSGNYFGPRFAFRGYPRLESLRPYALDRDIGARLWEMSEEATGVYYEALQARVMA